MELAPTIKQRRWNWHLWSGFALCIIAFVSYLTVFAKFPVTRDVPWVNFLLFGAGLVLLFLGLKHAFGKPEQHRGKIVGPILGVLSVAAAVFFCYVIFYMTKQLPASAGAPRVGQPAPEFVLPDVNNQPVSLASLLSTPLANSQVVPRGVLLIFYRGYW